MARDWLRDHRSRFSSPFFTLLNLLAEMHRQCRGLPPVSCRAYREYLRADEVDELPFTVTAPPVAERDDILAYIADYDAAEFERMVRGTFIGLLRHQLENRERVALLDFGTGPTCGIYNKQFRDVLFVDLDCDRICFTGIDSVHLPSGAVFRQAEYRRADIVSFAAGKRRFDLITGHHVLEHCYNWEAVMAELAGMLAVGGMLYLSFPRYGGFYDTVYRLLTPLDHCANFDMEALVTTAAAHGLVLQRAAAYVDPRSRFGWLCDLQPELIGRDIADAFYDLCVGIDARKLLGMHMYGHYVVFRKE
jgi:SAM-dependent methyltransferase